MNTKPSENCQSDANQGRSQLAESLEQQGYVSDPALISSLYLLEKLGKPLLLEGEAGVGKTEIAKCLAKAQGRQLIRLQCYEGLDAQHALYDWDYQRQLLAIQMSGQSQFNSHTNSGEPPTSDLESALYSENYLLKRPLFAAIASKEPVVLLIDEIDRADQEFEALLLEVLSDFQISIPELGTFRARSIPSVILTSNGVRELSDALRRRCLYHYIDYPPSDKEQKIIRSRLPGIDENLAKQVVSYVQKLRTTGLRKTPGVAESIDWASALMAVGVSNLHAEPEPTNSTLSCLVKTRNDLELLKRENAAQYTNEPDAESQ